MPEDPCSDIACHQSRRGAEQQPQKEEPIGAALKSTLGN